MIAAVEGPSAAGKSTWAIAVASHVITEHRPTGAEPDGTDLEATSRYWVEANAARWAAAIADEATSGLALCDGEPLKLHYTWCLAAVGAAPWEEFQRAYIHSKRTMEERRLGFADMVFVIFPDAATLRAQRDGDQTRTRRNFELHAQLARPLERWYEVLEALDPGRVSDQLPSTWPGPAANAGPRPTRYDTQLLEALVRQLGQPEV